MERNKIIAVAILAIGIIAWRMGAMESGRKRGAEESSGSARQGKRQRIATDIPADVIRVTFSDGKALNVSIDRARLFDFFNVIFTHNFIEEENRTVTLPEISRQLFQELLNDLDWVGQVRAQQQANETERQAARRMVQTIPGVAFDRGTLESLIAHLRAADFLQQRSLIELYAHQIVDMITSDESMRLLSEGNEAYSPLINGLSYPWGQYIAENMPRAAIWVEQYMVVHNRAVESVAISADGARVVTGSEDGRAKIVVWNSTRKAWVEQYTIQHNRTVKSVAISADGNRVVTGSSDGTAKIVAWNGTAWIEQYTIQHNGMVGSVAISADGNRVVTGSQDRTAKIVAWNGNANAWVEQYTIPHNRLSLVGSVAISADGNRVVTGSSDGTAKIVAWNGTAWIEQYTIQHTLEVRSVAISADGNRVVIGSWDRTAEIVAWNGTAWVEQYRILHNDVVFSVAISADGNSVVTGSFDNTAKIVVWNGTAWVEQYMIPHTRWVASVAISANGNSVVTGSGDKTAKIIAWNGNAWIEQYTIAYNQVVRSAALSADGTRVVTGSHDSTAKIFGCLPTSLPGISDFDACLFEHLLLWAQAKKQKISKTAWIKNILDMMQWQDLRYDDEKELRRLITENVQ